MYYDGKTDFYVKQYGPAVFAIVFSIILIGSGVFLYIRSSQNKLPTDDVILAQNNLENTNSSTSTIELPENLKSLSKLEKSQNLSVQSITTEGRIVIKASEERNLSITLIGVDVSSNNELLKILSDDLMDKEIKIAFDTKITDNSNIFAYVYINDILYNASLLEKGLAKMKAEKENISLLKELTQAQAYAKQTTAGIWEK